MARGLARQDDPIAAGIVIRKPGDFPGADLYVTVLQNVSESPEIAPGVGAAFSRAYERLERSR